MGNRVNTVCFTICIASIIAAAAMALDLIWLPESNSALIRGLLSAMIIFTTSGAILAINKTLSS